MVKRCLVGELGIVGIEVGHVLVPGMPSHRILLVLFPTKACDGWMRYRAHHPFYWLRSHVWGMVMNAFFTRCAFYCLARLIQICVLLYYVVYHESTGW